MTDILSVGVSGLRSYQTALTTTSENIANAGTAGYVRRTATVGEVAMPATAAHAALNGMGSVVTGIARSSEPWRAEAVRTAGSELAKSETSVTWLQRIQDSLTGSQLSNRIGTFFDAATKIAADPSASAPRAAMLESAAGVASAFTATGRALDASLADLDTSANDAVQQLNAMSATLAQVNAGLGRAQPGSAGQASLMDQRDRLLESMGAVANVSATFDSAGRAVVKLGDGAGPVLVEGDRAGNVTFVRNAKGEASFAVHRDGNMTIFAPSGGALAGMSESAQRIVANRTALNDLAGQFVDAINAFQAAGDDLSGNSGQPIFAVGDSPTDLSLVLNDPRGIAAAAHGGGARDNANLANLAAVRSGVGAEQAVTGMVTANASVLSARQSVADAQGTIRDQAVAARDTISGVNLDEEAVDLIRFQQAYQASSRVIQIARDAFQSILEIR